MTKFKCIAIPFLYAAWLIILVHNIVPHHHHDHSSQKVCNHQEQQPQDIAGYTFADNHDFDSDVCHFSVDNIIQLSIDHTFVSTETGMVVPLSAEPDELHWFESHTRIKLLYLYNNKLRAPPVA